MPPNYTIRKARLLDSRCQRAAADELRTTASVVLTLEDVVLV